MPRVFVSHPFGVNYDAVGWMVRSAIEAAGAEAVDPYSSGSWDFDEVLTEIAAAQAVIVDVSGGSPLVMYEMGFAHALGKPIIGVGRVGARSSPHTRRPILIYDDGTSIPELISPSPEFAEQLTAQVREALQNPEDWTLGATSRQATKVFVCYSHKDNAYLQRLGVHLKALRGQDPQFEYWSDQHLDPGDMWRHEIRDAITGASIAVLLVSADFLASDFILEDELPPLLSQAQAGGTRIVPVIVHHCGFGRHPALSQYQAVNNPDEPMARLSEPEQEEIFDRVAALIQDVLSPT